MMRSIGYRFSFALVLVAGLCVNLFAEPAENPIELGTLEVVPDRGQTRLQDPTTLATVLDREALDRLTASSLADLSGAVPGLTWAGGTSRARYLQMRGVGEVSQFPGEGPPNFSVGLIFDELDFSGLGLPASLFDIAEVEVLRGPQPVIYGSRAMAGLVHVRSNDPTPYHEARVQAAAGSDNYRRGALAVSGPLLRDRDVLQFRLVLEAEQQDGFRRNVFLGRRDTNNRDERMGRLKLRWQPQADWQVDLSGLYVALQNGYDAFAPDNHPTRTYTDNPGEDTLEGGGGALRLHWTGWDLARVQGVTSFMQTDSVYSYDADWGHDAFWAAAPYFWDSAAEGYPYDFFERLDRRRRYVSQDVRFLSHPGEGLFGGRISWQAGMQASQLDETDDFDGFALLASDYEARSGALYAISDTRLGDGWSLHAGMRVEQRETDYSDSEGVSASRSDTMWGGRVSLARRLDEIWRVHGAISRGFKGSGVNQNPALPADLRTYAAETLWNFETGVGANWIAYRLQSQLTAFYMVRDDLQIGTSAQFDPSDPTAFVYFTDNAARGYNRGVEWSLQHAPHARIALSGALSVLDSSYSGFDSAGQINQVDGRDQPFAPRYTYQAALQAQIWRRLYGRVEVEGRDRMYLAAGHDGRAEAYELVHLQAGWEAETWGLTARVRNVFDRDYVTQGYQFGLEPPDYAETLYVTYGEPLRFDITFDKRF
ncbi:MAG: TonB-dependent receptor [Kiritimatiellia bacterium]